MENGDVTSLSTVRRLRNDEGKHCISAHPNNISQAIRFRCFEFRHPRAAAEQPKVRVVARVFADVGDKRYTSPTQNAAIFHRNLGLQFSGKKDNLAHWLHAEKLAWRGEGDGFFRRRSCGVRLRVLCRRGQ